MSELTQAEVDELLQSLVQDKVSGVVVASLSHAFLTLRARLEGVEKERDEWKLSLLASAAEPIGDILKSPDEYRAGICEGRTNKQAQLATAQARVTQLESERDEVIRLSRFAVHDALLSTGHTKDEHTAAVFGQWKQAIDEALKAEARVREVEEEKNKLIRERERIIAWRRKDQEMMKGQDAAINAAIDMTAAHVNAECENGCGTKMRALLQHALIPTTPAGEDVDDKPESLWDALRADSDPR